MSLRFYHLSAQHIGISTFNNQNIKIQKIHFLERRVETAPRPSVLNLDVLPENKIIVF